MSSSQDESDGTTLDSEAELSTEPSESEEELSSFIDDGSEEATDSSEEYVGSEEPPTVGQLALPRAPSPDAPAAPVAPAAPDAPAAPATPDAPAPTDADSEPDAEEGLDGTYWGRPTGKRKREAPLPYTIEFDIAGEVAAIEEAEAMERVIGRQIRRAAETAWSRDPAEVLAWLFQ